MESKTFGWWMPAPKLSKIEKKSQKQDGDHIKVINPDLCSIDTKFNQNDHHILYIFSIFVFNYI